MFKSILTLSTPASFSFWRTVYSHGWCTLPPFQVKKENDALLRLLELKSGTLANCSISIGAGGLNVEVQSKRNLTVGDKAEIKSQVKESLRLSEDLSDFYREARRYKHYRWIPARGAGRMLRAPTVFEDVVKMICTTNCNWNLTEVMVEHLTRTLGKEFLSGVNSFPTPEALAGVSEAYLRKNIRAGYRSPYLLELAERVASGQLDLEQWRSSTLSTDELFKEVRSVKGMGDYAAGNILKLLGRYDYLGLDSWVRAKFSELHKNGRRVSDRAIERHYEPYGTWKGLFFWLEMTKEWYNRKFPF